MDDNSDLESWNRSCCAEAHSRATFVTTHVRNNAPLYLPQRSCEAYWTLVGKNNSQKGFINVIYTVYFVPSHDHRGLLALLSARAGSLLACGLHNCVRFASYGPATSKLSERPWEVRGMLDNRSTLRYFVFVGGM